MNNENTAAPGEITADVRSSEPVKFIKIFNKSAEEAVKRGYEVEILLGGPDTFPSHVYKNRVGGIKFFIYFLIYWTKMRIRVTGKTFKENQKAAAGIISSLGRQAEECRP